MSPIVSVQDVSKSFGRYPALKSVSFDLYPNEITALIGHNGAGKSTMMSILSGKMLPDSGVISFNTSAFDETKPQIGFLPEGAPLFDDLTIQIQLETIAGLQGLSGQTAKHKINSVLETFDLTEVRHKTIANLSKGFRRRVSLASTFLSQSALLILDEPTDGLDFIQKKRVISQLRASRQDRALLISTHNLDDIVALCERVIVIRQGEIKYAGLLSKLSSQSPNLVGAMAELISGDETE